MSTKNTEVSKKMYICTITRIYKKKYASKQVGLSKPYIR